MTVAACRILTLAAMVMAGAQFVASASAAPTAADALKLKPVQADDIEYDTPSDADAAKSTIKAERINDQTGWVVRNPQGGILRRFVDTNGDNVVDLWCYYRDGVEVYRDIDADYKGKATEFRWLNTAGTRWGVDSNKDGKIDAWKAISAEEASAEAVKALARRDEQRFRAILASDAELQSLGLGAERLQKAAEQTKTAATGFMTLASKQEAVKQDSKFVHFAGSQPAVIPLGTEGSTKDVILYDSVVAMYSSDDKHGQLQLGSLIKVGDGWRLIDLPQLDAKDTNRIFSFLPPPTQGSGSTGGVDAKTQELLSQLEQLDKASETASAPAEMAKIAEQKADLLEQLASTVEDADDRAQWMRQLADTLSAAVQSGAWPAGAERLNAIQEKLAGKGGDEELASYFQFRNMTAEYFLSLNQGKREFSEVQKEWLDNLRKFVEQHPKSSDTAEAMLQLAIAQEFSGQEAEAKDWYAQIVKNFPDSQQAQKASGAVTRLDCVGKPIQITGKTVSGSPIDLQRQYGGKVVIVQYWATWCEPAKVDMAQLKELKAKYGKDGLEILGVSLDSDRRDLDAYLKQSPLPWQQVYETGGLDSRLANEMGILTLPTMILIDKKGNVVNRNVHITELDREVGALLR